MNLRTTFFVFVLLLSALNALAQSGNATLSGTVKDEKGGLITDADVTITNSAIGIQRRTQSDSEGNFVIVQLPPGTYTVAVERQGFAPMQTQNIVLQTGERVVLPVVLKVGTLGEAVSVTADAGQLAIKAESGERSEVVTQRQIEGIALNGRNIFDLMKTIPGVTPSGLTAEYTAFAINGTRPTTKEVTIDGSSNVVTGANQRGMVQLNPDSVAEVKVLTSNFQAEYGRAGGGFIQLTTRSGTSEFHGGARYFRRHDSMNANSYFNNARALPRQLYRFNNTGYNIGGPIYLPRKVFGPLVPAGGFNEGKNKLFFFWDQEFLRQRTPAAVNTIRTPTAAERNGDFSQTTDGNGNKIFIKDPLLTGACTAASQVACFPGNLIPRNRFFKDGQALLSIFPLPNDTVGGARYNYSAQGSNETPTRQDVLRVDWNITERTRLTGRYAASGGARGAQPFGGANNTTWNFPFAVLRQDTPGRNYVLTLAHTFTPTLTNEFIYGPANNDAIAYVEGDAGFRSSYGITFPLLIPSERGEQLIPSLSFGGIANQTFPNIARLTPGSTKNISRTTNFIDNLTKVWGAHTIKAGVYWQRSHFTNVPSQIVAGDIAFTNDANNPLNTGHPFANALLGNYTTYAQASKPSEGQYRYQNIEWYAQDTWKVNQRLTLDYGLRMALLPPQYEESLQTAVFDPKKYDQAKAVRLYAPICVTFNTQGACSNRRAVDPKLTPLTPTVANTLPAAFIGLIVPGSGDPFNGLRVAKDGNPRGGFEGRGVQWGPRFGFAFDVTGDKTTVVRGGFGISYDRVQGNVAIAQLNTAPNIITPRLLYGNLADLRTAGGLLAPFSSVGYGQDGKIPNVMSLSLGAQRNIGFSTVLDVAYVGTLSRHLVQTRDINTVPYFSTFQRAAQDAAQYAGNLTPSTEPGLQPAYSQAGFNFSGARALPADFLRPYQGFANIGYREFSGSSNYHSLQVSVNRRFTRSLTFGAAYTWSKVFETGDADFEGNNPYDVRGYDYRLASFDRTHVFTANYVWDLPRASRWLKDNIAARALFDNWRISGITTIISGEPLELGLSIQGVTTGQRILGTYTIAPRFYLKGDPGRNANGLLIDPAAFVIPKIGDIGPYPRTYLRGPGFQNHDISIFKNIPFDAEGRTYLQLRFELFNAFNHTQFAGINLGTQLVNSAGQIGANVFNEYPNLGLTNNLRPAGSTAPLGQFFGEYGSARSPRIVQLAAKFYF